MELDMVADMEVDKVARVFLHFLGASGSRTNIRYGVELHRKLHFLELYSIGLA